MTTTQAIKGKELTGRKVLAIFVTAFGIIIGVNLLMAYSAISTFPGLVVKNGYIASQNFDRERQAQEALGLLISTKYDGVSLTIRVDSVAAVPTRVRNLEASVGRATHTRSDVTLALQVKDNAYVAPVDLDPGAWVVRLRGIASDGTAFRQDLGLSVRK